MQPLIATFGGLLDAANAEVLFVALALLAITVVLKGVTVQALATRRVRQLLASREPWTDAEFSEATYPQSPRKAESAWRVRALLERHEKIPMAGLRISYRIQEDLHLDLLADPNFFFELEEEFGFETPVHKYEEISALVQRLRTISDLVDYVDEQHWTK